MFEWKNRVQSILEVNQEIDFTSNLFHIKCNQVII